MKWRIWTSSLQHILSTSCSQKIWSSDSETAWIWLELCCTCSKSHHIFCAICRGHSRTMVPWWLMSEWSAIVKVLYSAKSSKQTNVVRNLLNVPKFKSNNPTAVYAWWWCIALLLVPQFNTKDSMKGRRENRMFVREDWFLHPSSQVSSQAAAWLSIMMLSIANRAAERIGGPRANTKSGTLNIDCVKRVCGHTPRKFWDFACSEVCSGGFRGHLFVHAYSTYILSSCCLCLAISEKYDGWP